MIFLKMILESDRKKFKKKKRKEKIRVQKGGRILLSPRVVYHALKEVILKFDPAGRIASKMRERARGR